MAERTRAATYQDVRRIAELLEAEGVEYALIGGYALALQGIVRLTEDVDILVEPSVDNLRSTTRGDGFVRSRSRHMFFVTSFAQFGSPQTPQSFPPLNIAHAVGSSPKKQRNHAV